MSLSEPRFARGLSTGEGGTGGDEVGTIERVGLGDAWRRGCRRALERALLRPVRVGEAVLLERLNIEAWEPATDQPPIEARR